MSRKVEEVARAIFNAWREHEHAEATWEDVLAGHAAGPDEFPNMHRTVELARAEALAAIKAMREPTTEMLEVLRDEGLVAMAERWKGREIYYAMIDEALREDAQ